MTYRRVRSPSATTGAACTRQPTRAAPYGDHYRLVVRTVADRKTPLDVPTGPYNVRNLAFSVDGKLLATAACVRAGRAPTGAEDHRFDTGDPLPCSP